MCVGTGVECTCLTEINSIQNSCIVILEMKKLSTCILRYVTLYYVRFRIFNSLQINTDHLLCSFVNNAWFRKEQTPIFHIHKLKLSVLFTYAVC